MQELRSRYGAEALPVPIRPADFDFPRILLLSLFDGIGGARRALERIRVMVCLYVSVELDSKAMRVVREAWPEVLERGDVFRITRLLLGPLFSKAVQMGCTILIVIGGIQCQDVSQINRNRAGAEGTRSGFFCEFIRVTVLAQALAIEHGLAFIGVGECTKMGFADKQRSLQRLDGLAWNSAPLVPAGCAGRDSTGTSPCSPSGQASLSKARPPSCAVSWQSHSRRRTPGWSQGADGRRSLRGGLCSNLYASNPEDSPSASGPRLAQGVLHSPLALLFRPASLSAVHIRGRDLLCG